MIVKVQESAKKDVKKIDKFIAINILKKIKLLENYPNITNIKKLKNHYPPQRLRIGNYRVFFEIDKDILVVVRA